MGIGNEIDVEEDSTKQSKCLLQVVVFCFDCYGVRGTWVLDFCCNADFEALK